MVKVKKSCTILYMKHCEFFERAFITEAIRQGELLFGSVRAYGIAVWPNREERTAGQTMYAMKNTTKTGKPQSVRLSDAVQMVEVLGRSFASFCFEISERIRLEHGAVPESFDGQPLKNKAPATQAIIKDRSLQSFTHENSNGY